MRTQASNSSPVPWICLLVVITVAGLYLLDHKPEWIRKAEERNRVNNELTKQGVSDWSVILR